MLKGFHLTEFHQILISFDFFMDHLRMACSKCAMCSFAVFIVVFRFLKFLRFNTVTLDRRMLKGFHLTEFHQILIIFEIFMGNVSVSRVRNV